MTWSAQLMLTFTYCFQLQELSEASVRNNLRHIKSPLKYEYFIRASKVPEFKINRTDSTVFARSNTGIMGLYPTQGMDVCLRLFCVCVVLYR
jgi:hypothetical protein